MTQEEQVFILRIITLGRINFEIWNQKLITLFRNKKVLQIAMEELSLNVYYSREYLVSWQGHVKQLFGGAFFQNKGF